MLFENQKYERAKEKYRKLAQHQDLSEQEQQSFKEIVELLEDKLN